MPTLSARNLSKAYKGRRVVNGISLDVNSGEVVGLLGPNGAGKTTCFYMIVGLVGCDQGSIYLEKMDITRAPMHRRARMGLGYLPQEPSVFRKLSVSENILAILETRADLDPTSREEHLHTLLDELHISHLKDATALSLSGGERRRVEIARALAVEPRFVLLDEPFAGVDPISVGDIQQLIAHLRDRGIGILITDHSVRETLGICDRAYIINDGQVIAEGDPGHILDHQHVRDVYLGQDFQL
jgi:lipopolysaccharide export system ATP-binding protein